MPTESSARASGLVAVVVGALAVAAYAVLGSPTGEDGLPTGRMALAALLVIVGVALRHERGPSWSRFVAGLLAGLIAADLVLGYALGSG